MLFSGLTPLLSERGLFAGLAPVATVVGAAGVLALVASFASSLYCAMRSAIVSVSPEGVSLRGAGLATRLPTARIRSALAVTRGTRGRALEPTVELSLDDGDEVVLELDTAERAEAFVETLGFGPGGKRVEVDLATPSRRFLHLLFAYLAYQILSVVLMMPLMMLGIASQGDGVSLAFAFGLGSVGIAVVVGHEILKRLLAAPVVSVGRDGVYVRRRGKTQLAGPAVGEQAAAPHAFPKYAFAAVGVDIHRRWAVWRHIARCASALAVEVPPEGTFERAGRDVAGWKERLARAVNDAGYRTSGLSPDVAARVLASPVATAEQRVGAALALRVTPDAEAPARIRVAAEGCADPDVRDALLAVAEDAPDADARVARALHPR